MAQPSLNVRQPPRLVVRTLIATFGAIGTVLVLVFLALWATVPAPSAWMALGLVAPGAVGLGAAASLWLARTVSRPIDRLSRALAHAAAEGRFDEPLARPGTSLELDALTDTFNDLVRSLDSAQLQTRAAYVGAIRALAAALDARDRYTAGHSERVSVLAVAIGRRLALSEDDIDVLRLGALLHDIGKIGVPDHVLCKEGPLTAEEFEAIKAHTQLGARILRSVPFLAPHLPIVELHHERPDGRGYPHGLVGHQTPPLARIVRVADAFDAMTSARAYRPARPAADALAELWQCAGSHFDTEVVEAFVAAWPTVAPALRRLPPSTGELIGRPRPVVEFPGRVAALAAQAGKMAAS
jgi:putative nucleotidyltransferase with HDIG domain